MQTLAGQIKQTLALDATDEDAPRAAGITAFATVAIGSTFEADRPVTVALKSLGVRRVMGKAITEQQRDILFEFGFPKSRC